MKKIYTIILFALLGLSSKGQPCVPGINSGTFSPKVDFASTNHPVSTALGDLDGDGKLDIALANRLGNSVSILLNTSSPGTVSFATKVDIAVGPNPWCVIIGDLNGDGKPDLAVTNGNSNTLSVFRNTGSIGSVSFAAAVNYTTGVQPYCVAMGDLDADGKPDLAVSNFNSPGIVSVYKNTSSVGSLSFNSKIDFATNAHPKNVAIGDLDGDGKPDLAVADYNTGSNTTSILRNTSSGSISFASKVSYSTGTNPYAVAISDFDGDGKPDLAIPNSTSNTLSVFRNTCSVGTISFAAKVDFITGTDPVSVAISDFDADGKTDIAVTNQVSNTVSVFKNNCTVGTISFAAKVDFSAGTTTYSLAIGDIDGDGRGDIAAGNANGNSVSVLLNVKCQVGIFTNETSSASVKIYPNPFSTQTNIEIENFQNENYELRMYDMLGKEVLRTKILSPISEMNRGEFKSGIYFIQVFTATKIVANEKIIIQ